jgi:hypothetical protein
MNPESRNQFQMPDAQFSANGNQSFLSQGSYQSFPQNMGMMPQQYQPVMSSFLQNSTDSLGMQAMNGMQYSVPGQMNAHLLQTQASQLMQNPQFRPTPDWRSLLSSPDRQHVINQLFTNISALIHNRIAQQGSTPTAQTQPKAESLARSLELHIYETAQSRVSHSLFLPKNKTHSLGQLFAKDHRAAYESQS